MEHLPLGTFINMATVIVGSIIGIFLKEVFPEKIKTILFQAIGLGTLVIGIQMALEVQEMLIFIFSFIIGGILGVWWNIEKLLERFGDMIKHRLRIGDKQFSEGMITAFLLYCIGSMTIVGAINEGISGDRELLLVKSLLDGITSIALASTYGIGVLFSIVPMFIFQGGITVAAGQVEPLFTELMLAQLKAVGGVLIIGISINMLKIGEIQIANLLPSLLIVVLFTWLYTCF